MTSCQKLSPCASYDLRYRSGFSLQRSHSRHHLARSEALSGPGTGKTLFPALERRTAFPTDQNHAWHGCLALPHPQDGSQRAGDASDRLQSHSRPDAASRLDLRGRLRANLLQRLAGQPPPFRRRHLCRSPQASQTGPTLRRSAADHRLRFGSTATRTQRTSRSKTSPKKLSTTYQTSQKNAHRTTPKPAQESILNVAYLSAILVWPLRQRCAVHLIVEIEQRGEHGRRPARKREISDQVFSLRVPIKSDSGGFVDRLLIFGQRIRIGFSQSPRFKKSIHQILDPFAFLKLE